MLALLAALAASTPSPTLEASLPWWERITVTVDDKGMQQSCKYQFSLSPKGVEACDEEMAASVRPRGAKVPTGVYSKLTYERRFSPGGKLETGRLEPGDKLIGQQVMFLTIDPAGSIESCRLVARSGEMRFDYGCDEAKAEQFRAEAATTVGASRQAFMTIRVYGHQEQIV